MASPVVEQVVESSTNTAGTSHTVNLPTATSGQGLLILLDKGSTAATINAHGSLTELLDENNGNGLYIAYRQMNGTEPSSYTLTSSANTRSAVLAFRISGADDFTVTPPAIATTATGTSATPDPPSITPPSSKDYLFIAFYGAAGEEADDDTWSDTPPTNYSPTPPYQKSCGTAGTNLGGLIAAAYRQLTTGSAENPGTFAKDVSVAWRAQTIIVHPPPPTFSGGDTVSFTETFLKTTQKLASDTISFTETFLKTVNKAVGDTVVLTEDFVATKVAVFAGSDTVSFVEGLLKQVNKVVGDSVVLTETFVKQANRAVADSVVLTETFIKQFNRSMGDTLSTTEALTKHIQDNIQETVTLTENLDAQLSGGGPPSYIFKAQVVPVYVAADPTAPGVVPMYFTSPVPGVTRVHTIPLAYVVAGCVPMRDVGVPAVGAIPVVEEV